MRIVSLLPSATDTIAELGLIDQLVGVSEDCNWPTEIQDIPVVTRTRVDLDDLSAGQIDRLVNAHPGPDHGGRVHSLYAVDDELLRALQPDLVITQDLCEVCAVSSGDLATACPIGVEVFSMNQRTLGDVIEGVSALAGRLGAPANGSALVERMRAKLENVERSVNGRRRPRVFIAEWMDPPYGSGHWIPEMVEWAGGENLLSSPGEYSFPTTWETVLELQPEVIVLAACGFSLEQSLAHIGDLRLPVRAFVVDGDSYYARPGPRVADGVRQLAYLLHSAALPDPMLPLAELTQLPAP